MYKLDRIAMLIIMITTLGIAIFLYKGYHIETPEKSNIDSISIKIDSLSKIRDTIKYNITNMDTAIYNNSTIYVKERNSIINQSSDSDMQFFTNYIQEVGRRLLIDTISIKGY